MNTNVISFILFLVLVSSMLQTISFVSTIAEAVINKQSKNTVNQIIWSFITALLWVMFYCVNNNL